MNISRFPTTPTRNFYMKPIPFSSILFKLSILVIVVALLAACGSPAEESPNEVVLQEDTIMESSSENSQTEMNTTGASFEEQELPADFPEEFPIPKETKIGSTVEIPGENSYRIFFGIVGMTLEEVLTFYQQELQVGGWSVDAEGPEVTGYGMWITHPEYEAKLNFIEDEYGVVLDLAIAPLGQLIEIPTSGEAYEKSEGLGAKTGDIPADFPKPASFTIIDLPPKLAGEGYQLAFSFQGMAELAIMELSTALRSTGWEIGTISTYEIGSRGGFYTLPFSSASSGFHGYALITAKADVAGLDSISGAVIALHTGDVP